MSKPLIIASTFSGGYGSFIFALKYASIEYDELFACEIEKAQRASYILNHGEPQKFYSDILKLDAKKYRGLIDLLWQSPSCKQYSPAGQRNGLNHEDGMLMDESIRIVAEAQPRMFIIENSRGLLSVNGGRDWKAVLKAFNALGNYTISWGLMNAKEQGTPQNRDRVFIVGVRANTTTFSFPRKVELQHCLNNFLEEKVSKKYFLSMKMLKGFMVHKGRHKAKGNGFGFSVANRGGGMWNNLYKMW